LTRDPNTAPVNPEAETVVVALERVPVQLAHGKRQVAVRTTIFESHWLPAFPAEKHDRFAEKHATK
jgi:hypothetical protein